jgi:sirohydrochlorin ferrochelatase
VAGNGGTALTTKLGIEEGDTIALLGAPEGLLAHLPDGVVVKHHGRGRADVVVAFFVRRAALTRRMASLGRMVFPAGGLWIAWPKKASPMATDLTDHAVRQEALPLGLVDNKVCAVDETWTGLRLVWRLENRSSVRP